MSDHITANVIFSPELTGKLSHFEIQVFLVQYSLWSPWGLCSGKTLLVFSEDVWIYMFLCQRSAPTYKRTVSVPEGGAGRWHRWQLCMEMECDTHACAGSSNHIKKRRLKKMFFFNLCNFKKKEKTPKRPLCWRIPMSWATHGLFVILSLWTVVMVPLQHRVRDRCLK